MAIGRLFGGESMFQRQPDASKAALVGLVAIMRDGTAQADDAVIDCQWLTPHMASLGAIEVSRDDYLARLARAVAQPVPSAFARPA